MTPAQRSRTASFVFLGVLGLLAACKRPGGDDIMADYETLPSARPAPSPTTPPPAPVKSAPSASAPASASAPPVAGSASASASPSGSGSSSKPPAKVFACGDKGKPDCPMQKWMKGVAGGAIASGDGERIARAFNAMSRPPPGMGAWAGICATGAAKAQAGDIDGAKAQCKACHAKYQSAYRANLRDMAWP